MICHLQAEVEYACISARIGHSSIELKIKFSFGFTNIDVVADNMLHSYTYVLSSS